ncbi:PKD-like domain-containing protein [Flavobacterium terrigena]|uniref:Por secretion system C-terminal sorting domain-containing protein n=1 Tax=Flavobacterium terrigena TaxID=402734 RepID=A0A1H6R280_9FLAO|nr:PKD-like domain-containing protein [Flavobacterium terrigena]SEI45665.1 Por secretion system C-terminal sorting domain-containing protein [Flavobacterium terrigena]
MKHTLRLFLITILFLTGINAFAEKKTNDNLACPTAAISYSSINFCSSITNPQAVTLTGTDAYLGGFFSSTPAGLALNPTTGEIIPSASTPGMYTVEYTISAAGSCGAVITTTTITITPSNNVSTVSSNQTLCIDTPLTQITLTTTGATGIGTATELPPGVNAIWSANHIVITGTPISVGIFNYSIPLTGGCGTTYATGTITVTPSNTIPNNTVSPPSSTPTLCLGSPMTTITHATTGATGIIQSGLPVGVTANWSGNVITISGTPVMFGVYNYSIPLTGGCGTAYATGTITVYDQPHAGTDGNIYICENNSTIDIFDIISGEQYGGVWTRTSGTGGTFNAAAGTFTSAMGATSSSFMYTVPATSTCSSDSSIAIINIMPNPTGISISGSTATCAGTPVNLIITGTPGTTITMTNGSSQNTFITGSSGSIIIPVSPTVTTTYTLISASLDACTIPIIGQSATVTINQTPQFITQIPDITICNGGQLNIASQLTSTVPGATFTWSATTSNVNTTTLNGNQTNIDQVVNLIGVNAVGTITIQVRPEIGSCYGMPQQIAVTVQPIPTTTSTTVSQTTICNNQFVTITSNSNSATAYNWQVNSSTGVQIVGGTTSGTSTTGIIDIQLALTNSLIAGTISFNVTPVNGICTGTTVTNAVTITVNPLPGTPIAFPTYAICSGETSNLTIATFPNITGTELVWTVTDSQNVTGFSNGIGMAPASINDILINTSNIQGFVKYSVTTKLGNCEGGTTEYTVLVNPLPYLSNLTDGEITFDGNGNLIPYVLDTGLNTFDYSFEWYLNSTLITNANSNTYSATEEGIYSVKAFSLVTGCENYLSADVTENLINNEDPVDLVMYPNPSFDSINFSYNSKVKSVQISNQMGQTVLAKEVDNLKNGTIDISVLNIGIYNIEFETESGIVSHRIIKQ